MVAGDKPLHSSSTPWQHKRPDHIGLRSFTHPYRDRTCTQGEAEEQLIGTSHAEIGAYLLGLWGIDSLVVEAVAHHHRPDRITHVDFDTTTAVYIADLLERTLDHSHDANETSLTETDEKVIEALGLSQQYPALRNRAMELFA